MHHSSCKGGGAGYQSRRQRLAAFALRCFTEQLQWRYTGAPLPDERGLVFTDRSTA